MSTVTIFHNPRCSKSRATMTLLEERKIHPDVVKYLENPPDKARIEEILSLLGAEPRELMRKGEAIYTQLGLAKVEDRDRLIEAMVEHPILIERPIVISGKKARIGRPPERVLEIL